MPSHDLVTTECLLRTGSIKLFFSLDNRLAEVHLSCLVFLIQPAFDRLIFLSLCSKYTFYLLMHALGIEPMTLVLVIASTVSSNKFSHMIYYSSDVGYFYSHLNMWSLVMWLLIYPIMAESLNLFTKIFIQSLICSVCQFLPHNSIIKSIAIQLDILSHISDMFFNNPENKVRIMGYKRNCKI